MHIIKSWTNDPARGQLTQKDRKNFIESAYTETDEMYFGTRQLSDHEVKLRALTKVFYKVLAEEPWSEDWIRAPDVERKLSKFEMHKGSIATATQHNLPTPREAVKAAREAYIKAEEAIKAGIKVKKLPKDLKIDRGPYDEIEIIYIAGTVSSTATNKIDRDNIYPVSVSSVAEVLQNHICKDMVRPFTMAESFMNCTDTTKLETMRDFACNVCDFAPHLLDNDNISLLVVLLILSRSECCRRFENNGIRIEGSTISHRKSECMKNKLNWKTSEEKKPYDSFANEFQTRVKNACFPAPRAQRVNNRKQHVSKAPSVTLASPQAYGQPHMGYVAPPQIHSNGLNSGINVPAPAMQSIYTQPESQTQQQHQHQYQQLSQPHQAEIKSSPPTQGLKRSRTSTSAGNSATEPMDIS